MPGQIAEGPGISESGAHSPWQRGSNKNTKGLLRDYFQKGTDLSVHSPEHLLAAEMEQKGRPRHVLAGHTPAELFETLLASQNRSVVQRRLVSTQYTSSPYSERLADI